ncbi:MAG: NAD(P)-dependent alcohol dehydrogenase [Deltaproteobacteria bacterium]|nr:NAD(P)-dependent alcohol dehydrogenase [Deltaproteobacteria bacterium]
MDHQADPRIHGIEAAVLRRQGGPLRIEALELEGPRDDEVLVRLVGSGICHTDIDFRDSWSAADGPLVLGHEGAGVVEQVGADAQGVKPGDHVVLSFQSCGQCHPCLTGRPARCDRFMEANFGFARLDGSNALRHSGVRGHFFGQSSFASHTLATSRNMVKVDKELPLALLAPLGCGLQTGAGTVLNSLAVRPGQSIAIFGAGAVGLAAVMAAAVAGAEFIIGVDLNPLRLELARELGATHVINNSRENIATRIRRITGRGVDFVLEITGSPRMLLLAVQVLNPHGTVALIAGGNGPGALPGGRKSINIIQGDAVPQRFIPQLIDLYRAGQFPFDRLVRFYDFKEINQAIADAKQGYAIKPVLRISEP